MNCLVWPGSLGCTRGAGLHYFRRSRLLRKLLGTTTEEAFRCRPTQQPIIHGFFRPDAIAPDHAARRKAFVANEAIYSHPSFRQPLALGKITECQPNHCDFSLGLTMHRDLYHHR